MAPWLWPSTAGREMSAANAIKAKSAKSAARKRISMRGRVSGLTIATIKAAKKDVPAIRSSQWSGGSPVACQIQAAATTQKRDRKASALRSRELVMVSFARLPVLFCGRAEARSRDTGLEARSRVPARCTRSADAYSARRLAIAPRRDGRVVEGARLERV